MNTCFWNRIQVLRFAEEMEADVISGYLIVAKGAWGHMYLGVRLGRAVSGSLLKYRHVTSIQFAISVMF